MPKAWVGPVPSHLTAVLYSHAELCLCSSSQPLGAPEHIVASSKGTLSFPHPSCPMPSFSFSQVPQICSLKPPRAGIWGTLPALLPPARVTAQSSLTMAPHSASELLGSRGTWPSPTQCNKSPTSSASPNPSKSLENCPSWVTQWVL